MRAMTHAHRRIVAYTLAGALLVPGACRTTPRGEPSTIGATLVFVNESLERAQVFAVARAVSQEDLGIVMQGERQTFLIPARILRQGGQSVTIVVRTPSRSRSLSAGPVVLSGGEVVQVTLPIGANNLIIETGRH